MDGLRRTLPTDRTRTPPVRAAAPEAETAAEPTPLLGLAGPVHPTARRQRNDSLLGLQRVHGNRHVARLVRTAQDTEHRTEPRPDDLAGGARPALQDVDRIGGLTSPRYAGEPSLEAAFRNSPPIVAGVGGEGVRRFQAGLVDAGYPLPGSTKPTGEFDGLYGQETVAQVRALQTAHGLDADGVVGHQTLGVLDRLDGGGGGGGGGGLMPIPPDLDDPPLVGRAPFFLVDEPSPNPRPKEVVKGDFLRVLEEAVRRTADEALTGSGRTAEDCPYIPHWFGRAERMSARDVEAAIRRFAPESAYARSPLDYVDIVCGRARTGIERWRATGDLSGVPEGVDLDLPDRQSRRLGPDNGVIIDDEPVPIALMANPAVRRPPAAADPAAIRRGLGTGQRLDVGVTGRMGAAFGEDFSGVRVHADGQAAALAADLGARAFTVGEHVAFGSGEYQPGSPLGDALIAHELAHVRQQRDGAEGAAPLPMGDAADAALEEDADRSAAGALAGLWGRGKGKLAELAATAMPRLRSGLRLQRCDPQREGEREVWTRASGRAIPSPELVPGNVPGERPVPKVSGDTTEVRFDGDGDESKELQAFIRATDRSPDGSVRAVHLDLTQISSAHTVGADFTLPDAETTSGPLGVFVAEVGDGKRPTELSLVEPSFTKLQVLRVYPPHRSELDATYEAELMTSPPFSGAGSAKVSQRTNFAFPPETAPIRKVFEGGQPMTNAGVTGLDVDIGAYRDRFRLTFHKPDPNDGNVDFGISVISEGAPVAGQGANLTLNGPLRVQLLPGDGVRLPLDLDGDGRADLELYDRLSTPANLPNANPATDRDHDILLTGPSAVVDQSFTFPVRGGMIRAGTFNPDAPFQPEFDKNYQAATNAQALSGLAQQQQLGVKGVTADDKRGTRQGELDQIDALLSQIRKQALDDSVISVDLGEAWGAVERDFIILAPMVRANSVELRHIADIEKHALRFYELLAREVASQNKREIETINGQSRIVTTNEFTELRQVEGDPRTPGTELAELLRQQLWNTAARRYQRLVHGLDLWIARIYQVRNGDPTPGNERSLISSQIRYLTNLRHKVGELADSDVRVPAVFHPDAKYREQGQITEQPLTLYYFRKGDRWVLVDYLDPQNPWHAESPVKGNEPVPTAELFQQLDADAHLPEGVVHYQVPNGPGGRVKTTGQNTFLAFLTLLSVAGSLAGLAMVSVGTAGGLVPVIGAVLLAVGAAAGGASALVHFVQRQQHGDPSPEEMALDLVQVAAAITGLGALAAGRIAVTARNMAAAGHPPTGPAWAMLAKFNNGYAVPLAAANATADAVTLALVADDMGRKLNELDAVPMAPEDRTRTRMLMLGQFAVTGGLTALSLRGNVAEITPGRKLEIVNVDGRPVVLPQGLSLAGERVTASRGKVRGETEAAFDRARQEHLRTVEQQVEGPGGKSLAGVEDLALRTQFAQQHGGTGGTLTVDAAGNLTSGGQRAGTLQELTQRVAEANNAARAHGMDIEYVLEVVQGATPDSSQVRVRSRPRNLNASSDLALDASLYSDVPRRAEAMTQQIQRLRHLDAVDGGGSQLEIEPTGEITINGQARISQPALAAMTEADARALLGRTRQVAQALGVETVRGLPQDDLALLYQLDAGALQQFQGITRPDLQRFFPTLRRLFAGLDAGEVSDMVSQLSRPTLEGLLASPQSGGPGLSARQAWDLLGELHATILDRCLGARVTPRPVGADLRLMVDELDIVNARGIIQDRVNRGEVATLPAYAEGLRAMVRGRTGPTPALGDETVILDAMLEKALLEQAQGGTLDAGRQRAIAYVNSLGPDADLRNTAAVRGEQPLAPGARRGEIPLTIGRDSPEYTAVLGQLTTLQVGGGERIRASGDLATVADVFAAYRQGGRPPKFATQDAGIYRPLFDFALNQPGSPLRRPVQQPRERYHQAISRVYGPPDGFLVTINDGTIDRTIRVVPVP